MGEKYEAPDDEELMNASGGNREEVGHILYDDLMNELQAKEQAYRRAPSEALGREIAVLDTRIAILNQRHVTDFIEHRYKLDNLIDHKDRTQK